MSNQAPTKARGRPKKIANNPVLQPTTSTSATLVPLLNNNVTLRKKDKRKPNVIAISILDAFNRPILTATPPTPPNWLSNFEDTIASLLTFKKYSISSSSAEYQTIKNMLHPVEVRAVSQIVNPELWKRFVSARNEMIISKTEDLHLLAKFDLDEREMMRRAHLSLNWTKDPLLHPYSDNMALLFHCTRNQQNLNNILCEGLDERLSNSAGNLGKGIYFSDDPRKSICYDGTKTATGIGRILIFAVLLGDCISVDHFPNKKSLVREPKKVSKQKRNFYDMFFDSIVAKPVDRNEYVIYNRHQCCPIYEIEYQSPPLNVAHSPNHFNVATESPPPIAWIAKGQQCSMPNQDYDKLWPFYAAELFFKMGSQPPKDEDDSENRMDQNVKKMLNFGLLDVDKNKRILLRFNNDLNEAIKYLLKKSVAKDKSDPSTAAAASTSSPICYSISSPSSNGTSEKDIETIDLIDDDDSDKEEAVNETLVEMDNCLICYNEYECFASSPGLWEKLKCSHKLCLACFNNIRTTRTTMSVVAHTFVKCPFCLNATGIEVGDCPDIQMNVAMISASCESYEDTNSISIHYSGNGLNRTCYLPNNTEGQGVLQLLKIAWDRRLCFSVGTSATTGRDNVITWNIHHKTSLNGGISCFGFPDPGYMDRVKLELKGHGIE